MLKIVFLMIFPALLALANPEQLKQPSATIEFVGLRDSWCSTSGCPNTTISNGERVTYGLKFQSILTPNEKWAFRLQLEGSSRADTDFTVWDGLNFKPAQMCVSNWPTKLSGANNNKAKNLKACTGECDNDGQCSSGLLCFQRKNGESIPGCTGQGGGRDWNYCYDPNFQGETSSGCDGDPSKGNYTGCTIPAIGKSWIQFRSSRLVRWSDCTGKQGLLAATATTNSVLSGEGLTTLFVAGSFGGLPHATVLAHLGTKLRVRFRAYPIDGFCVVQEKARCTGQVDLESQKTQAACALAAKNKGHSVFVWAEKSKSCSVVPDNNCATQPVDDSAVFRFNCEIGLL